MPRKIDNLAAAALVERRPFSGGNTIVQQVAPDVWSLSLHGSTIAKMSHGVLSICAPSPWNTPTTRARLNALPGVCVWTKGGALYVQRPGSEGDGIAWTGDWLDVRDI